MIIECGFCHNILKLSTHINNDLLDIYMCEGCLNPNFDTKYRQIYFKGQSEILAATILIDEYFVLLNYAYNFTSRRTNYTSIYKNVVGELKNSFSLIPITWSSDLPIYTLDFIIKLPLHDPAAAKEKLQIYTIFS